MKKSTLFVFILTAIFFIYFSLPFFHHGFFPTMDDVQVVRIDQTLIELKSGQFPVRYIDSFGNRGGYMLFNYYSPLPYYIGSGYELLVKRPVKATKMVFLTALLIGSLGIFFLLRRYTNAMTSFLSVCLFLSSAYLGYDIYLRGALAEIWGMVFFPWILWSFLRVKDKPTIANCIIAGIFYALVILSHIAIAFFFSFFLFFMICIPPYKKKNIVNLGISVGIGLLLSAFFWLPILIEQNYIVYQHSEYATKQYLVGFLSFNQLIGFRINPTQLHATLGLGLFLLTIASGIFLLFNKKNPHKPIFIYFFIIFFCSLFFVLPITKFIWDKAQPLRYLQSPWRFLAISTIYAIFICGIALSFIKKWWIQTLIVSVVVIYTLIFQTGYMRPYAYNDIPEYKAEGVCGTTTWKDEYLPKWVSRCLPKEVSGSPSYSIFSHTASKITDVSVEKNGRLITFETSGKEGVVTIAKYYFPNWHLFIDEKKTLIYPSTQYGLITFTVPRGSHQVRLVLGSTFVQTLGNVLSLSGLCLILYITFRQRKEILNRLRHLNSFFRK